ncbi:ROK family protein [Clostridium cuniculi]|uniref:ROK family protein n=1 Tax=Clostridium cuniculi TaxID=2548455 RepID=UPI00105626E7|nr:ROK family protein [Clostridium cuniculi]
MRILALDIGGTAIKIGIINEKGEIIDKSEVPTMAQEGGQALINRVFNIISQYENIDRIGISTAGQVDHVKGKIIFASDNIPGWTGMEIKKRIEEKFNIPTVVENDVNAAAIGEAYYGAGLNNKSFLCIAYGTGIGGAIVEKGEIYRGGYGSAGEFGHIITHAHGKVCTCGANGCYEAYASTTALVEKVKKELGLTEVDGRLIFDLINENEKVKNIVDQWILEIIFGLVNLVHIFNPSLIVLGGGIMEQEYIVEYIKENICKFIMPNYRDIKFERAKVGNNAGILGIAHLAMRM